MTSQDVSRHWVLVADEAIAKLLSRRKAGAELAEVDAVADPDAHAKNAEFRHDADGRRNGRPTVNAGDEQRHLEAARFAKTVAERLLQARRAQRYDRLTIVAAPRFLGALRKELAPEVSGVVVDEQAKDLQHLDAAALTARLFPPEAAA